MILRKYRHKDTCYSVSMTFPRPKEEEAFYTAFNGQGYRKAIEEFLEDSIRQRLKYAQVSAVERVLLETLRTELKEHVGDLHLI